MLGTDILEMSKGDTLNDGVKRLSRRSVMMGAGAAGMSMLLNKASATADEAHEVNLCRLDVSYKVDELPSGLAEDHSDDFPPFIVKKNQQAAILSPGTSDEELSTIRSSDSVVYSNSFESVPSTVVNKDTDIVPLSRTTALQSSNAFNHPAIKIRDGGVSGISMKVQGKSKAVPNWTRKIIKLNEKKLKLQKKWQKPSDDNRSKSIKATPVVSLMNYGSKRVHFLNSEGDVQPL